jgi:hypothetical protein
MYDAEYHLLLLNLFEFCRPGLSLGLVSEVKRNLLCCACPWKGSCKENVQEAHPAAYYPCLWKQEHKAAVPGA